MTKNLNNVFLIELRVGEQVNPRYSAIKGIVLRCVSDKSNEQQCLKKNVKNFASEADQQLYEIDIWCILQGERVSSFRDEDIRIVSRDRL